ncbi:uncharacterized protein BP01DRAFT_307574 [Aspergillus saccharolyticus JOP 1030-1]|uniref:Muramidase n=1 Tax=Aspergillus saccharolyticus JOP 1030-1 TaxID=1450539 RepID=A0A318Z2X6_9EURO|nr:hypothetical protein BP01DRAFT_307574 [Aspergillus saccharolyticus JOP 1030-1]PYH40714.1 hypothetical protein BP01DRAFT_307574 [Aspergillus saccharolyticus JOP 1030-1]
MGSRTNNLASRATNAVVSVSGLAVATLNGTDGSGAGQDVYTLYSGDGSVADGWPAQSSWVSFDDMWKANKPTIMESCTQFGVPNNSANETQTLYESIQQVAKESHLDHRFILAIIMQESKGCVRVDTTNYGVRNPGLMQDHDGTGTCNDNGVVQNPCPRSEILQMVRDGAIGTAAGDGLASLINQQGKTDVSAFYRTARLYNSGSISDAANLNVGVGTACYATDVANRLTGWVNAATKCTLSS